jgi:MYXO-CTERM domain-containing protein
MRKWINAVAFVLAAMVFVMPSVALAGRFLFVSDTNTDNNIPTVLRGDGHTVDVVINDYNATTTNNARLQMPIGAYNAVFWSATGGGAGSVHSAATITNLTTYVNGGGRVFVTGYDSIASPTDPPLIGFLGGTGSIDVPGAPGPVASVANALTTGVVDIRGVTPTGASSDRDALTGVMAGTVIVVPTMGSTTEGQWVLRTLGTGLIAYVSNGEAGPMSAHPAWTTTTPTAAGAYNAALRNFVASAVGTAPPMPMLLPNGSACMAGSQCTSTFCADGVCCNSACAGGTTDCQACAMAAGAPSNGTCAPVAAGRSCRDSAGDCDVAETCNGTATTCPADGFAPSTTVCRPAAMGGCDIAETCSGTGAMCPENRTATDGTPCSDTLTCNGPETCRAGACSRGTALSCDDGDPCTADMCVEPTGCARVPIPGCGVPDAGPDVPGDVSMPDADAAADADADMGADVSSDVAVADADAAVDVDAAAPDAVTEDVPQADAKPDLVVADVSGPDVADAAPADASPADAPAADAASQDAAVADVTTGDDAAADDGSFEVPPGSSSGCGCAVPGRGERSSASLLGLAGLAALLGARRRRDPR